MIEADELKRMAEAAVSSPRYPEYVLGPAVLELMDRLAVAERLVRLLADVPIPRGIKLHWPINYRPVSITYADVVDARAFLNLPLKTDDQ